MSVFAFWLGSVVLLLAAGAPSSGAGAIVDPDRFEECVVEAKINGLKADNFCMCMDARAANDQSISEEIEARGGLPGKGKASEDLIQAVIGCF